MAEDAVVVALRSADPELVAQVQEVARWWQAQVVVRAPGTPPPPAHLHLDSPAESNPADPSWGACVQVSCHPREDAITLPDGAGELADAIAASVATRQVQRIGVVGARGGIGTSVLAALLARAGAESGRAAALVDLAGGLDLLLGLEEEPGPRWADLPPQEGPYLGKTLLEVLPSWRGASLLAADERGVPDGAEQVLEALAGAAAVMVVDLGRGERPLPAVDDLVVVTSAEAPAAASAAALIRRVRALPTPPTLHLAVRVLPGVAVDPHDVARVCGLTAAFPLPYARRLTGDLAHGVAPGDRGRSPLVRAVRPITVALGWPR